MEKHFSLKSLFLPLLLTVFFTTLINCSKNPPEKVSKVINIPNPPTNVAVSLSFQHGSPVTNLTWKDNSDNEQGFRIEGRTREQAEHKMIAAVDKNITTFVDTTTPVSSTYYYRVNAFNENGESSSALEGIRLGFLSDITKKNISDYEIYGGIMFLLWQNGLTPINISDPAKPIPVRTFPLKGYVKTGFLSISGTKLFIVDDKKLFIMSIKNPLRPTFVSALDIGTNSIDMVSKGDTIFLLKSDGLLDIIDAHYSRKPKLKRFIKIEGHPKNMLIKNEHMYIANERDGIYVYKITNPLNPVLVEKFVSNPAKLYNSVSWWDGNLIASVRDFENEIHIIDGTNPEDLKILGTKKIDWIPQKAVTLQNILIVPEGTSGAEIMWGADPKKLKPIGSVEAEINTVKVWESFIVMSNSNRLFIFSVP